ncbi:hybrid sensor histidine kinase/response regulator [Amantichitinum ursilacus]|uniref:histidine kinase n=1 Tax=Amantichitinum ursilacus TaxID=857265 RepID=A0A0N0GQA6_9NEIS|nr:PAS domain S-box protein [Amantichitinum ursilacus]KPC54243.1 Blue-light-activated protein [Amantichitinum ursilacus]
MNANSDLPRARFWSVGMLLMLLISGICAAALWQTRPWRDAGLHTMLDSGMFLLSLVLALLFGDRGRYLGRPFLRRTGLAFGITALFEAAHLLTALPLPLPTQWAGMLTGTWRPISWPAPAYLLPAALMVAVHSYETPGRARTLFFALGCVLAGVLLSLGFSLLPRYTEPVWLGITRPALAGVSVLWALALGLFLRWRRRDRILPLLILVALIQWLGSIAMLYSAAPHDTCAVLAHLARITAELALLTGLIQLSSYDVLIRRHAEAQLAALNQQLEHRVLERTRALQDHIDERVRVQQTLQHMADIIDSSEDAIIGKTLEGVITSWNQGARKIFGYQADEAIGRPLLMLIPPDRQFEEADILARIAAGESVEHFETVRQCKNGRLIHVSATISPIRDAHGAIVGASKIARDITERVRVRAALQEQLGRINLLNQVTRATDERQDMQSIFQVVVRTVEKDLPLDFCAIGLYDPVSGHLRFDHVGIQAEALGHWLSGHERLLLDAASLDRSRMGHLVQLPALARHGLPLTDRLAQAGLDAAMLVPMRVEQSLFGIILAARRGNTFSVGDTEFLRQLGEHVAMAAHQAQLHAELQQAYDELRQTQEAALQKERLSALGQMASGIAHDINNAISPVALYTETLLLQEATLSARGRGQLEIIQRAVNDVAQTVARMKEFYRPQALPTGMQVLDLNQLVSQVLELSRARWSGMAQGQGGAIAERLVMASGLPAINGVASEIREALTNLVLNAADAMPQGGTLTVQTRPTRVDAAAFVVLEVTDTGMGMDEDTRKRCLEPFFTTKGERGTGLGLAMVYGICQRHGADVQIRSAPGAGTTVQLTFAASPLTATTENLETPNAAPTPAPRRILVVDDDPQLLGALLETLRADGHTVTAAHGGQAGIQTYRQALLEGAPFDIVMTDWGMPDVDGGMVASAIKAIRRDAPIILLTGWGQHLRASGDIPAQVDLVLSKPPRLRELREALRYFAAPPARDERERA